jgi:hypothetical protein
MSKYSARLKSPHVALQKILTIQQLLGQRGFMQKPVTSTHKTLHMPAPRRFRVVCRNISVHRRSRYSRHSSLGSDA